MVDGNKQACIVCDLSVGEGVWDAWVILKWFAGLFVVWCTTE